MSEVLQLGLLVGGMFIAFGFIQLFIKDFLYQWQMHSLRPWKGTRESFDDLVNLYAAATIVVGIIFILVGFAYS